MSYNSRSPAVKRLMKEAQELAEPTELYSAQPLEDNLFEWHFTIRGPEDTPFQGGIYHGRILLPSEYPMKPPNILLLTPNGRFEVKRKICLSISGYHPESWRPCWSIRTALLAIIGFMPTHGGGAIGSLEFSAEERKKLAKESVDFVCPDCGPTSTILLPQTEASIKDREEAKTLASQIDFQGEKAKGATSNPSAAPAASLTPQPAGATSSPAPAATPTPAFQGAPLATNPLAPFFPVGADAGQMAPWAHYPYYYNAAAMGQAMPGGPNMTTPLSFEQWLLQIKGFKPQTDAPATSSAPASTAPPATTAAQATTTPAPATTASAPATTAPAPSTTAPAPATTAPAPATTAATGASPPDAASNPDTAGAAASSAPDSPSEPESELRHRRATQEPETSEEPAPEAEPDSTPSTGSASVPEASHSPVDPADEWPLLSVFVICLLLLLVLVANRFILPRVFALIAGEGED